MQSAGAIHDDETATATSKLDKEDQEHVDAINATVDRMQTLTAPDSYILTIPQDVTPRYHHASSNQARQWLDRAPFDPREDESIQYQTFVYHDPAKEMFMQHNSRLVEDARNEYGATKTDRGSGAGSNTPHTGTKKKITLDAYKRKQAGEAAAHDASAPAVRPTEQPAKKAAVKGPTERLKVDEEVLAAVEDVDGAIPSSPLREERDRKRKREDSKIDTEKQAHGESERYKGEGEPATKKGRVAPHHADEKRKRPTQSQSQSQSQTSDQSQLPTKLSPPKLSLEDKGMPPRLSPLHNASLALPSRLSPTLPRNITATLNTLTNHQSASQSPDASASNLATQDAELQPIKKPKDIKTHRSPVSKKGVHTNSSSPALRSDAEVGTEKKMSLIVKLRFEENGREAVRKILRRAPNPEKRVVLPHSTNQAAVEAKFDNCARRASDARHRERRDANARGVAQKVTSGTNGATKKQEKRPASAEKRSHPDEAANGGPPAKRKKVAQDAQDLGSTKEPSTPTPSNLRSPPATTSSQKQITPSMRKDLLSVAMKRDQSNDGNLQTPSAARPGSPIAGGRSVSHSSGSAAGKALSNQPSNKSPLQHAWEIEQKRLETLGRELKHAASAHLDSSRTQSTDAAPASSNEHKLAAVKSVESLLAYLLAFTCADEAAAAADPAIAPSARPWRSLQGYFGFVKRNCDAFPHLQGLACWLGVAFNARILDISTQHPSEAPHREAILETTAMLQRTASDAESRLDIDALETHFPRTWKARSKGALAAPDKPSVGKFAGPFKLPVGVQTPPLRAVRAGHATLDEWNGKEKTGYGLKLRLG